MNLVAVAVILFLLFDLELIHQPELLSDVSWICCKTVMNVTLRFLRSAMCSSISSITVS